MSSAVLLTAAFNGSPISLSPYLAQNPEIGFWITIGCWSLLFFIAFADILQRLLAILGCPPFLGQWTSSPLSYQLQFATQWGRITGITTIETASFVILIVPSIVLVTHSLRPIVGLIVAFIPLMLLATSLAVWLGIGLARCWGATRARLLLSMGCFVLFFAPIFILLSSAWFIDWTTWDGQAPSRLWQHLQQAFTSNFWWGRQSWLWLPARTLLLELKAIVLTFLFSVGLTGFTYRQLPTIFINLLTQPQKEREQSSNYQPQTFTVGITRNIIRKEWRNIRRRFNPFIGYLNLAVLIFIVAFIIQKVELSPQLPPAGLATSTVVLMSLCFASWLTTYCVAGEEAMGWLRSVPVSSPKLRESKLLAALIPVWVVLSPSIGIVISLGGSGLMMLVLLLVAPAAHARLRLWSASPVNLAIAIAPQCAEFEGLQTYIEVTSLLSWTVFGMLLQSPEWAYGLLVLPVEVGILGVAYWRSRQLGESLIPY
ncbi:MAG: hypothetical protein ACFCU8_06495 [Thermosynechococcaceae cyanobacterium]